MKKKRKTTKGPRGCYRADRGMGGAALALKKDMAANPDGWLHINKAANLIGIHRCTVYRWLLANKAAKVAVGRRTFVRRSDMARIIKDRNGGTKASHELAQQLLGEKQAAACRICGTDVPLAWDTCSFCEEV